MQTVNASELIALHQIKEAGAIADGNKVKGVATGHVSLLRLEREGLIAWAAYRGWALTERGERAVS